MCDKTTSHYTGFFCSVPSGYTAANYIDFKIPLNKLCLCCSLDVCSLFAPCTHPTDNINTNY